jgi:hypothetical protein
MLSALQADLRSKLSLKRSSACGSFLERSSWAAMPLCRYTKGVKLWKPVSRSHYDAETERQWTKGLQA